MRALEFLRVQQAARWPWALLCATAAALLCLAHYFFQNYLYMQPCEQCVYIRFAVLVVALGGFAAAASARRGARVIAYILGIYGAIIGVEFCLKLHAISEAVRAADPFAGVPGCREAPVFPFGLPLHDWAPGWFAPTGDCGLDAPIVPEAALGSLSALQQWFAGSVACEGGACMLADDGLYSAGWYLIPVWEFVDMATACLLFFLFALAALLAMFAGFAAARGGGKWAAAVVLIGVAALYFAGGAGATLAGTPA